MKYVSKSFLLQVASAAQVACFLAGCADPVTGLDGRESYPRSFEVGQMVVYPSGRDIKQDTTTFVLEQGHPLRIKEIDLDSKRVSVELMNRTFSFWVDTNEVLSLDDALKKYTAEMKKSPRHWWPRTMQVRIYGWQKNYEQGLNELATLIQMFPNDPSHLLDRVEFWVATHEYRKAIDDLDAAQHLHSVAAKESKDKSKVKNSRGKIKIIRAYRERLVKAATSTNDANN